MVSFLGRNVYSSVDPYPISVRDEMFIEFDVFLFRLTFFRKPIIMIRNG